MAKHELRYRLVMSALFIALLAIFIPLATKSYFRPIFVAAIALIAALGYVEYLWLCERKKFKPCIPLCLIFGVAYVISCYFAITFPAVSLLPYLVPGLAFVAFFLNHFRKESGAIGDIAVSIFGLFYIPISLSSLIWIVYHFPAPSLQDGRWWLVYALAVTKMTDVGGYIVGKTLGKKKLAPHISPGKTVAGSVGGILFALATASLLFWIASSVAPQAFGTTWLQLVVLAFFLSITGQLGDLSESLLKRDASVKDSHPRLPGLGGVLDVVDALLLTSPLVLFYLWMAL